MKNPRHEDASHVVQKIASMRQELSKRFTVLRIGVFGSFVRGTANPESDIDIMVEFAEPTFDHYMDLKFKLEEVLQRPVDLVIADTIKPRLKPIIEQELVYA
jgi:predicted nucleotidyltransferase